MTEDIDGGEMREVVIVSGGDGATGGCELLHQLSDVLISAGIKTKFLYWPFRKYFEKPKPYENYKTVTIRKHQVSADSIIVLPEVYSYFIDEFPGHQIVFWWLSVDNYFGSRKPRFFIRNLLSPFSFVDVRTPQGRRKIHHHLVQSEYARHFLQSAAGCESRFLGDFINDEFVVRGSSTSVDQKEDIVAYNPAKGVETTRKVISRLAPGTAVPIVGMSRGEVMDLLARAKVYVDFGNHPGQDRIPREAAALGCCVITNQRGSAANDIDVPVDRAYKIDDNESDFAVRAADKIGEIFSNFEDHSKNFSDYRAMIRAQKWLFERDALEVFKPLVEGP